MEKTLELIKSHKNFLKSLDKMLGNHLEVEEDTEKADNSNETDTTTIPYIYNYECLNHRLQYLEILERSLIEEKRCTIESYMHDYDESGSLFGQAVEEFNNLLQKHCYELMNMRLINEIDNRIANPLEFDIVPPKKLKKRIEQYENILNNVFALDKILDLLRSIEESIEASNEENIVAIAEDLYIFQSTRLREMHQLQIDCVASFKDTINEIKRIEEKRLYTKVFSIPFPNVSITEKLKKYNNDVSLILVTIYHDLQAFIEIQNFRIQQTIIEPLYNSIDLMFFYSYLVYKNCHLKGYYDQEDLKALIKIADSNKKLGIRVLESEADLSEKYFHPVIDTIIALLALENPHFYINDELLNSILEVLQDYQERDSSRTIGSSISHARSAFMSSQSYKHPIYEVSDLVQTSLRQLPSFLTNTSEIQNWPPVKVIVQGYNSMTLPMKISVSDLAKFQTHLDGSMHLRLFLKIPTLTVEENEKLYNSLIKYLSCIIDDNGKELNLLGSCGAIRLPALFKYKPHDPKDVNPELLVQYLTRFIEEYCQKHHPIINIDIEVFSSSLLTWFRKFSEQYGLMSYGKDGKSGLALFDHIKILKLLYQILSNNPSDLDDKKFPQELLPSLWQSEIDKVLEVLAYTLKVSVRVKNISTETNFETVLYDIAQVIINKIASSQPVILQVGIPKLASNPSAAGHTFYIVFQSLENDTTKIIIVDGGSRDTLDPQYDRADRGMGARILCRETTELSLSNNREFLTHYIHKTLMLRYESCSDEHERSELIDNIKLKNGVFIGKGGINIADLPSIELEEKSHSMASQNFEDCTMSNFRESLRILFSWNSTQMAHFQSDAICRYNFLLYQNNQHIQQPTLQATKLLQEETKKIYESAASLFLQEHYSDSGHRIEMVPTDGNCFYHAVAMILRNIAPTFMMQWPEADAHIGLRNAVIEYLRRHSQLISNEGIDDIDGYLNRISNHGNNDRDGEWADAIQLQAMLGVMRDTGLGVDNIIIHTDNNQLQLADYHNFRPQNIIHLYNHRNHYMPIVENLANPIGLEVDEEALAYEDIADQQEEMPTSQNYLANPNNSSFSEELEDRVFVLRKFTYSDPTIVSLFGSSEVYIPVFISESLISPTDQILGSSEIHLEDEL